MPVSSVNCLSYKNSYTISRFSDASNSCAAVVPISSGTNMNVSFCIVISISSCEVFSGSSLSTGSLYANTVIEFAKVNAATSATAATRFHFFFLIKFSILSFIFCVLSPKPDFHRKETSFSSFSRASSIIRRRYSFTSTSALSCITISSQEHSQTCSKLLYSIHTNGL